MLVGQNVEMGILIYEHQVSLSHTHAQTKLVPSSEQKKKTNKESQYFQQKVTLELRKDSFLKTGFRKRKKKKKMKRKKKKKRKGEKK